MFRLFIFAVMVFAIHFWWAIYSPKAFEDPIHINIRPGSGVSEILAELQEKDVIKNNFQTKIYIKLRGLEQSLHAGEYIFSDTLSTKQVIEMLIKREGEQELTLTFIEGWTIQEMAEYLEDKNVLDAEEFLAATKRNYPYNFLNSKPSTLNLEGFLFPDTYRVFVTVTADELVKKILDNFDEKLDKSLREEIIKQGRSLYDVIILASILEKEVVSFEDKKLAADVFLKRLEEGIGLGADSTVNYVTGKQVTRASREDIKIDSPYNTYKYRGLPPGPISNPGLEAILAAVYPKANSYYYFLTTKENKTIFSRTLEEHNINKSKFLD